MSIPENVKELIRAANDPQKSEQERQAAAAELRAKAAADANARANHESRLIGSVESR